MKLTIELVPSTAWFKNFNVFIIKCRKYEKQEVDRTGRFNFKK